MRFSVRGYALVLVVVVAVTAGGLAFASIPDSNGVIHGCYSPNGAKQNNGTQLNIIDGDSATCNKNQQEVTWSQTGPQGLPGQDGVSVTSASLSAGDTNCPEGGSQFTASGNSITYACNGAKGDQGDTGPAGPSNAFTNYGDGVHHLDSGNTQTIATVTLPIGSYTLSGSASVASASGGSDHADCFFSSFFAVANGHHAVANLTGTDQVRIPVIGDVTITADNTDVFLRCHAISGAVDTAGEMIATQVGMITAQ